MSAQAARGATRKRFLLITSRMLESPAHTRLPRRRRILSEDFDFPQRGRLRPQWKQYYRAYLDQVLVEELVHHLSLGHNLFEQNFVTLALPTYLSPRALSFIKGVPLRNHKTEIVFQILTLGPRARSTRTFSPLHGNFRGGRWIPLPRDRRLSGF